MDALAALPIAARCFPALSGAAARRRGLVAVVVIVALGIVGTAACSDLSEFEGRFDGVVVGGEAEDSFIRRGFEPDTRLLLQFDPDAAIRGDGRPGSLTTDDGRFDDTPLRTIEALQSDQLSRYDFPGGGRLRNFIFAARSEALGGEVPARDVLVFVSLMDRGRVEVRIVSGPGDGAGDLFGLFLLRGG